MSSTTVVSRRAQVGEQPSSSTGVAWWLVALPGALAAAVAASVGITSRQMWNDEYITWLVTTISWSELWRLLHNIDIAHALYYLVMREWTAAFGHSTLALRVPSIIGVAVAAGAVTLLGRRLWSTMVGVAAGLVFAGIPTVSRYGQEARAYAWVTALAVLSTLALIRAVDRPGFRRWLVYGGCLLVLTCLHFVAALIVVPHALMMWHAGRRGARLWRAWLVTIAVIVLAAAPLLYQASKQPEQASWIRADQNAVMRFPSNLFGSETAAWVLIPLGVLGVAVLWYADRTLVLPLLTWAVLPTVFCYVTYPVVHLFLARYVLFSLPAWALLVAIALGVPLAALRRWMLVSDTSVILMVLVLALAAAGTTGQQRARQSPVAGEADFRAAAELIDARYQPGDGIAYAGTTRNGRIPLAFELRQAKPRDVFLMVAPGKTGWYSATECPNPTACLGDTSRLWLVVSSRTLAPFDEMPAARAELLRRQFTIAEMERFSGIRVLLLVRH